MHIGSEKAKAGRELQGGFGGLPTALNRAPHGVCYPAACFC